MFKTNYRIVTDKYLGFEAQYRRWWMPFYMQIDINTHPSIESAIMYIELSKVNNVVWKQN